jgi:hypothetical protein
VTVSDASHNVAHTVAFFQTAFTIVLALALGESLKQFVSDEDHRPLHWDRMPSFASFILILFPFFQGMGQHMFTTYLDPATAPPYRQAYLMFDGVVFLTQAAIFYVMARAIPPRLWRRYYGAVLMLLAVDTIWAAVSLLRGIQVGFWVVLNAILAAVLLAVLWWERSDRGAQEPLRPAIICAVAVAITTSLSYFVMTDFYFSR